MKLSHYTKKIAAAVCAFSALTSALFTPNYMIASAANSYRYGEFMVQDQADGSMLITGLASGVSNITIPDSLNGGRPTVLSSTFSCSAASSTLTSLSFSRFLSTEIPAFCFRGCNRLQHLQLSKYNERVHYGAFERCSSLRVVHMPFLTCHIEHGALSGTDNTMCVVLHNPNCKFDYTQAGNAYAGTHSAFLGTIYAERGTAAEAYARNCGYRFVAYKFGDVNDDGYIDSRDASKILSIYAGSYTPSEKQRIAADINMDGCIDSRDASLLLQYYAYCSTRLGSRMNDSLDEYLYFEVS